MTLLAGQTALWLWLAAGLLFVLATLALLGDVQRFIALTEEARSLVPAGLPLFDGEKAAATTAALVRLPAKKDETRRALWTSRNGRPPIASTKRQRRSIVRVEVGSQPSNREAGAAW